MDRYESEKHYFEGRLWSLQAASGADEEQSDVLSGGCVCYDPGCRNLQQLEFDLLERPTRIELQQSV